MKPSFLSSCLMALWLWSSLLAQPVPPLGPGGPDPDDAATALAHLPRLRQGLMVQAVAPEQLCQEMLRLGMWTELSDLLRSTPADHLRAPRIGLALRQHRYHEADSILRRWLAEAPQAEVAHLLAARLRLQAWDLDSARRICLRLLDTQPRHLPALLCLGEVDLLDKQYRKALARAEQAIQWDSAHADAWYLMGEAYFWLRKPQAAEEALARCLRLDPYHADARFAYGYAIWRRVDATQLPDMAAQWEVALAVHPLHFRTHWHWGNGHTPLTFADYVDPNETAIREELALADDLIAANQVDSALHLMAHVQQRYPQSVIPVLHRGSAWYMRYDRPLTQRLDSAQRIFADILARKAHYGPAHNGLAAVIKQRQFAYLRMYDSLEQAIATTEIGDLTGFAQVFPDVTYYPGQRVQRMVWGQLHSSVAYFPFLAKLNRQFVIPPLHHDLSLAMDNKYFRYGTTFDNRQWMDIRGVGSGATGIEYVERGAHLERNVTLHEYVHLFHGQVFTEAENRAVRARYYHAMAHDLTLDYYAANNEWEYLAQTFPAYFIPLKVHPLNHKAVNTRSDLQAKDPLMYAFIDSLVHKQRAYLAGDSRAMADNWAQVYLRLAQQAQAADQTVRQFAYLDTAYTWDSSYLPVYLAYAEALLRDEQADSAQVWLDAVAALAPDYAPQFETQALAVRLAYERGALSAEQARPRWTRLLKQALRQETDYELRADLAQQLWATNLRFAHWQEAIEQAESYALDAPTLSTSLRDRVDEALAVAHLHRGLLGYADESLDFLADLVARKPQRYGHRVQYARVLLAQGRPAEAAEVLEAGWRVLAAAGQRYAELEALLMQAHWAQGDTLAVQRQLAQVELARQAPPELMHLRLALGDTATVAHWLRVQAAPQYPQDQADWHYLRASLALVQGDTLAADGAFAATLGANPYHLPARLDWLASLHAQGRTELLRRVAEEGTLLPLPPGPIMQAKLMAYLPQETDDH